ncbi:amidase [Candidatus Poribacteria bacterium]|nr:amidase [Candidatus Poribacteria bacterium]
MSKMDDIAFLDATAQAELVRRKEVKPIELVEAAIERIERLNPQLNAVVTPMYEQGRAAAKSKLPDGPFTGVPFLLKDLGATYAGVRQTSGSAFVKDFVPDHDSELVKRHKRAGLVFIGKTNTPEFGILPTTESHLLGPARNPWNTKHSTGGSSGGSAAAVAAGIVPIAHANDGGGSIRIPASCCGLFGLKPTRGRNPLGPDFGDMMNGFVVEHAVTRSVRDSAALLDATAGPDLGDPYWAPPQERPFIQEVGANPGKLRIAFMIDSPTGVPVHEDCKKAVREAAKLCADLGHEVTEAAPALDAAALNQAFITVFTAGGAAFMMQALAMITGRTPTPDQFEPLTWAVAEMGKQQSAPDYVMAVTLLQQVSRQIARFMVDYDVLLTPTLAEPPLPLGTLDSPPENPLQGLFRAGDYVPFTPIFNATGQPAVSIPLYWNGDGLPIGTHFVGRFGDEATLFRLAAQLEKARPWAERRPSVSV